MKTVLLIFDGKNGAASTPISDSQVNTENTWSYVRPEFAGDRKFWISFRTEYSNNHVSCSTMTSDVSYDTLGGSVSDYQKIYRRSTQKIGEIIVPTAPNKWETINTEVNDNWTTHKMAATDDYPYVFSCTQYRTLGGTVQNTTVAIDTETVIDTENGFIKTNLIDVNTLKAKKGLFNDINVSGGIEATRGSIGGLEINSTELSAHYSVETVADFTSEIQYSKDGSTWSSEFTYEQIDYPAAWKHYYFRIKLRDGTWQTFHQGFSTHFKYAYAYSVDENVNNLSFESVESGLMEIGSHPILVISYSFPSPESPLYYKFVVQDHRKKTNGLLIKSDGKAVFGDATFEGTVRATDGIIGGLEIKDNGLVSSNFSDDGNEGIKITASGKTFFNDCLVRGAIRPTKGLVYGHRLNNFTTKDELLNFMASTEDGNLENISCSFGITFVTPNVIRYSMLGNYADVYIQSKTSYYLITVYGILTIFNATNNTTDTSICKFRIRKLASESSVKFSIFDLDQQDGNEAVALPGIFNGYIAF